MKKVFDKEVFSMVWKLALIAVTAFAIAGACFAVEIEIPMYTALFIGAVCIWMAIIIPAVLVSMCALAIIADFISGALRLYRHSRRRAKAEKDHRS